MPTITKPSKEEGKKVGKAEVLARELKRLIKSPHGHFFVASNSERVLAIQICEHWRLGGYVDFIVTSWKAGNAFKIVRKN